jgi:tetratricopeptide (TPR) repeat protein
VPGSTLPGGSVTFTWSGGAGAAAYWLDVGTVQGRGDIFGQNVALVTTQAVTGIPTTGVRIYVRLWTLLNGAWQATDYTYVAAGGSSSSDAPVFRSFIDSNGKPSEQAALTRIGLNKPAYCVAEAQRTTAMSAADAIVNLRNVLIQKVGQQIVTNFESSADAATAPAARLTAAAALMVGNQSAALAALLALQAREPGKPTNLMNLGGMAASLGWPNEALALLAAAEQAGQAVLPLGLNGQAVLLNNRGFAYLMIGDWSSAETALRRAVELEPLLAEAKINLSRALLCAGNANEAAHFYSAGQWRTVPTKPTTIDDETGTEYRDPSETFDLDTWCQPDHLPPTEYPLTATQAMAWGQPFYIRVQQQLGQLLQAAAQRGAAVSAALNARELASPLPRLSAARINGLVSGRKTGAAEQEAALDKNAVFALQAFGQKSSDMAHRLAVLVSGDIDRFPAACRAELITSYPGILQSYRDFEGAMDALYSFQSAEMNGIISNIKDPLWNDWHFMMLQQLADVSFATTQERIATFTSLFAAWGELCGLAGQGSETAMKPPDPARVPACPANLEGMSLKVALGPVGLTIGCEEVEIEIEGEPGPLGPFSPFARIAANPRTREVTAMVGAKLAGSSGLFEFSADEGFFISGTMDGQFRDAGVRWSTSAEAKHGGNGIAISGAGMELTIMDAVANWRDEGYIK